MLSLRQKMLVGFGGLLLIIIILSVRSIIQVTDLGSAIQAILRENYRSVVACQDMKDSINRMDHGALLIIMGYRDQGMRVIAENAPAFEDALNRELNNITMPGEGQLSKELRDQYPRYASIIRSMEDKNQTRASLEKFYFVELTPVFGQIKDSAGKILSMNQHNMEQASRQAKIKAANARKEMYALSLLGALLAVIYILLMGRWILQPIMRLTRSVGEIRKGNLDLVVTSETRDEIGQLSEAFNDMTAGLRELRRSDQARLVRLQHSVQQTFDSLPNIVAIVDLDGIVEMATETARSIFGLKPDVRIKDLHMKWMDDLLKRILENPLKPGGTGPVQVFQHFINAEEHYFQPMAVSILNDARIVTGVILIINDVTQRLEQDEMKRDFVSTISHQLRTPLTSIRMALHVMLEEKVGTLAPQQSDLLTSAKEDTDRLYRIIEDLLSISTIESRKGEMELATVSPHLVVQDAVGSFRSAARGQGVHLEADLPDDLPEILADREQVRLAFDNLISNALKYTPSGGSISISAETLEHFVWFIVSDTGIGIQKEYIPRLFERFFRVPGQEVRSGTGLGLAIVREIVEGHGGTIRAESTPGRGSTFIFSIPRADGRERKEGGNG
jgi:two-component system, NtrC family, sensor histidine kinase KinB